MASAREEVWKVVDGFNGAYEVSSKGRVRNARGRILATTRHTGGYLAVRLSSGGKNTHKKIHRLVAAAFVPPFCGEQVNHKDFNRQRNEDINLEWMSRKENILYSVAAGRYSASNNKNKEQKLDKEKVKLIRLDIEAGMSQRAIGNKYHINKSMVGHISCGRNWSGA